MQTPYKRDWLGREMPSERPVQTAMEAAQEYLDFYDMSGRKADRVYVQFPFRNRDWSVEILCTDGATVIVDGRFIDHMRAAILNDVRNSQKTVAEVEQQKKMDALA